LFLTIWLPDNDAPSPDQVRTKSVNTTDLVRTWWIHTNKASRRIPPVSLLVQNFRGLNQQKRPQPPKYRKEITRKKTVKICGIDAKGCPLQSVNWKRQAEWIWFGWSRGAEKGISKN
jgi:hypothetical protein